MRDPITVKAPAIISAVHIVSVTRAEATDCLKDSGPKYQPIQGLNNDGFPT